MEGDLHAIRNQNSLCNLCTPSVDLQVINITSWPIDVTYLFGDPFNQIIRYRLLFRRNIHIGDITILPRKANIGKSDIVKKGHCGLHFLEFVIDLDQHMVFYFYNFDVIIHTLPVSFRPIDHVRSAILDHRPDLPCYSANGVSV